MRCEDVARLLYAEQGGPELEPHLAACADCRAVAEDLAQLRRSFDRARAEWAPSPRFRVSLPAAPWRRLAVAACLLVVPLAAWAASTLRAPRPRYDLTSVLEPRAPSAPPSDPQLLASLFLEETNR
jgi:hypothetical protein